MADPPPTPARRRARGRPRGEPAARPLAEQVLDVAVFAPIGLVDLAADQLTPLVAQGRDRLGRRLLAARMVGKMAVTMARRRADQLLGPSPGPAADHSTGPASRSAPPRRAAPEVSRPAPAGRFAAGASGRDAPPEVGKLAITAYDSLAASQVVRRLDSLGPEELDAVRRYEEATRRRRTILGRLAQLQGRRAGADGPG